MPAPQRTPLVSVLPDFPWDSLGEARAIATAHPDGLVDLTVGAPVDPVAETIRGALYEGGRFPGYPTTLGTAQLRETIAESVQRRYQMRLNPQSEILPVIGTKEAIAWLPTVLGIGAGHSIVIPELAYPTYEVGALLSGARVIRADGTLQLGPETPTLWYLNSPGNPSGKVLGIEHLRKVVAWARDRGVIVASDECYLGLSWDEPAYSILDERVCDGDTTGLLAIHSLSKTSNMAGYRGGFIGGDPALIAELLEARKHAGLMVPYPVQQAMIAAYSDDEQEVRQRRIYRQRREVLSLAVRAAGLEIVDSTGGLYLWATRGEDCRDTVAWLASHGILVAPGEFYGPQGQRFVRFALTATDAAIEQAVARLSALGSE